MKVTRTRDRSSSLFVPQGELDTVLTLPAMPVCMSATTTDPDTDKFCDMTFALCKQTGLIQLTDVPYNDDIYSHVHNDAIGPTWIQHNEKLAGLVHTHAPDNSAHIVEVGGGSGKLASIIQQNGKYDSYTIVDPNQVDTDTDLGGVTFMREYLTAVSSLDHAPDVIIHSHTLEHVDNPIAFITLIASHLAFGGLHIFSLPNLKVLFDRCYLNALQFEHSFLIREEYVDAILHNCGFDIVEKTMFREDHSCMYVTKYTGKRDTVPIPSFYNQHLGMLTSFKLKNEAFCKRVNVQAKAHVENGGRVYVYGGHSFTQFLISFGLDTQYISCILDNSELKIGKRLYGTTLTIRHPSEIRNSSNAAVILRAAGYQNEIKAQLNELDPSVDIWELLNPSNL